MRTLELLAPAKNLECAKMAIDHGADAVYIGATRFGARAAAGNSVEDIRRLCEYAHPYGARVYVTVNTIIYEDELSATRLLLKDLNACGVDALLVQDMGILEMVAEWREPEPFKMELHASTQTDNRSAEKVRWLQELGFKRAVLARELSAKDILEIHEKVPDMELEVFVHGALCVSYSGVCYASEHCFHRSANRGSCAQFCRMKFDLLDNAGRAVERQRYLLSMRDMCRIDHLELLADSGACSFKIEGRLKDVEYVKNVVSAYSRELDKLIAKRPDDYWRASYGKIDYTFQPNLRKTFNRGFTNYFLEGRQNDIACFDTPKVMGEYVGKVKELRGGSFNVAGTASFENGDGLCFVNDRHELEGFRINKAVGNRLYPLKMPADLKPGVALYRNNDVAFSRLLSGVTAERRLPVKMKFHATADGFALHVVSVETGVEVRSEITFAHQEARQPQHDNIKKQLTKLGNTVYSCNNVEVEEEAARLFVPSSLLAELRRDAVRQLVQKTVLSKEALSRRPVERCARGVGDVPREYAQFPYLYNISNHLAERFYQAQGLENIRPAFELAPTKEPLIMQCRHCIKYSLGFCVKRGGKQPTWTEPLYLRLGDGRRFRLEFNCAACQMNIYAE
ncbi:peptidase U32 family protein [Segatella maculosa]|uniref:peptidase U32 family protein n=1 Tax=Segatella maculosa TaxID=439703 RepID=UPI0023F45B77|nr:U32 family peptidase [Segatella maculosa]